MSDEKLVSTSRLAEQMKTDAKALFQLLTELGWIVRDENKWKLTAHGELEGGQYQRSEKYGEYIVWPQSLAQHPLLASNNNEPVSATRLAEIYNISAFCINALFSELGWLDKDQRGWMLTELGAKHGGSQRNGKHGFFVLWPASIVEHSLFKTALNNLLALERGPCLDGLLVSNAGEQRINNWLYLHQIVRAYRHPVPGAAFNASFYLPARKVYIDYWGFDFSTGSLSEKLAKQDYYKAHGLRFIEIGDDELNKLDEILPKKLLPFGIQLHTTQTGQ